MKERHESLIDTLNSLVGQADMIGVCMNDYSPADFEIMKQQFSHEIMRKTLFHIPTEDLTDAGKFYWLNTIRPDFYLTCDDDLIYPDNYVNSIVQLCNHMDSPVSYHGYNIKRVDGMVESFIRGRMDKVHCLHDSSITNIEKREVIGTGVACFPQDCFTHGGEDYLDAFGFVPKMADLNVSKLAARLGIDMYALPHHKGFIKHSLKVNKERTIWAETAMDDSAQIEFLNG